GPWTQYPDRMLQMRARSFALRDVFPDILLGLSYAVEELKDITPAEEVKPVSKLEALEANIISSKEIEPLTVTETFDPNTGEIISEQSVTSDQDEQQNAKILDWYNKATAQINSFKNEDDYKEWARKNNKALNRLREVKEELSDQLLSVIHQKMEQFEKAKRVMGNNYGK
ncbi:MAG: hypothetical protein K1X44_08690, partial [Alphaproteobacteria bacterium]|nr:hypothetical protein [Alphaproteobacteria bacterium]